MSWIAEPTSGGAGDPLGRSTVRAAKGSRRRAARARLDTSLASSPRRQGLGWRARPRRASGAGLTRLVTVGQLDAPGRPICTGLSPELWGVIWRCREERDGVRGSSPADGFRRASVHARSPRRVHEGCCATRLRRRFGQRPHGLLGALARRTGGACGSDGTLSGDDAGDDGRARGGARTGACRQDLGSYRSAVGRSSARGGRSGLVARGLRRRRPRFLGTVAALRRGDRCPAGVVASRQCTVRRPFLLDGGTVRRAPSGASGRSTDLGR